jgi:hypothetical protein
MLIPIIGLSVYERESSPVPQHGISGVSKRAILSPVDHDKVPIAPGVVESPGRSVRADEQTAHVADIRERSGLLVVKIEFLNERFCVGRRPYWDQL